MGLPFEELNCSNCEPSIYPFAGLCFAHYHWWDPSDQGSESLKYGPSYAEGMFCGFIIINMWWAQILNLLMKSLPLIIIFILVPQLPCLFPFLFIASQACVMCHVYVMCHVSCVPCHQGDICVVGFSQKKWGLQTLFFALR